MADQNTPSWIQYTLSAHNFGLTLEAILMDLHNHVNKQITQNDIRNILISNNKVPKEQYKWYNLEYLAATATASASNNKNLPPQNSYPWNAWTARYAYGCKLYNNNTSSISVIWEKMLSRGYELPIDMPIHTILNARQLIENQLLAVCSNPIALAEVYIPAVLRAHGWGYTLNEILQGIFLPDNIDETDMFHLRQTLDSNGVKMGSQRTGRNNYCFLSSSSSGNNNDNAVIVVERFVQSAHMIGMQLDEINLLCYAHGFDIRHTRLVEEILTRLEMLNEWVREANN